MQGRHKKKRQERLGERIHPGDPEPEFGAPGSIEQQLDMVEEGTLKGDQLLHERQGFDSQENRARRGEPLAVDELISLDCYDLDLAEESREGCEMTGDEHSSGLQGGESELVGQPHLTTGMPGEQSRHEEFHERHREDLDLAGLLPEEAVIRGRRGRR
jgi:hypothetical protein